MSGVLAASFGGRGGGSGRSSSRGGRGRWGDGPPRAFFWLGIVAMLALMPVLGAVLGGCTAGQAREQARKVESRANELAEASDAIGEKIAEATAGTLAPEHLAESIGPLLPDHMRPGFEEAMRRTDDAIATALEVNRAVAAAARETAAEARRLHEKYADAKADDDATIDVIGSILTVGLSLLMGGGVAGGLVAKVLGARTREAVSTAMEIGREDGKVEGARVVTHAIEVGRELSPDLDKAFRTIEPVVKLEMHKRLEDADVLDVVLNEKLGPGQARA